MDLVVLGRGKLFYDLMFIEHFDMILPADQNLSIHHVPHSSCALSLAGEMMGNGWKCFDSVAITCLKLHSCSLVLILKLTFILLRCCE